ncbi:MAG: hypothetical protein WCI31_08570 [Prolixibacteraceae bacterium]
MRKFLYILAAILCYITLSSKSCSEGKQNDDTSQEEKLIHEKADIRNEFESEFISEKSVHAFESKAEQKLTDLSDYLNILCDSSVDKSFKEQSKLMAINLFVSDTTTICHCLTNDTDLRKESIRNFLKAAKFTDSKKITLDSIRVTEQLHFTSEHRYKGLLAFSRRIKNISAKDTVWSVPASLQAEFFVSKIHKIFGKDTLQIWNLSLGNIE